MIDFVTKKKGGVYWTIKPGDQNATVGGRDLVATRLRTVWSYAAKTRIKIVFLGLSRRARARLHYDADASTSILLTGASRSRSYCHFSRASAAITTAARSLERLRGRCAERVSRAIMRACHRAFVYQVRVDLPVVPRMRIGGPDPRL